MLNLNETLTVRNSRKEKGGQTIMTIRDKLSMFFEVLLNEIELIDNVKIKEVALQGLMTQVEFHLKEVKHLAYNITLSKLKENTDDSKETI